jgi:hypothetical protein
LDKAIFASYQNFRDEFFVGFGLHLSGLGFGLPSGAESTAQPVNKRMKIICLSVANPNNEE